MYTRTSFWTPALTEGTISKTAESNTSVEHRVHMSPAVGDGQCQRFTLQFYCRWTDGRHQWMLAPSSMFPYETGDNNITYFLTILWANSNNNVAGVWYGFTVHVIKINWLYMKLNFSSFSWQQRNISGTDCLLYWMQFFNSMGQWVFFFCDNFFIKPH